MLGIETADGPDHPYAVTKYLPAEKSALDRLHIPSPKKDGRMPFLVETAKLGADILSVEGGIDLANVKNTLGPHMALSGNLDGIKEIWQSQPQDIGQRVRQLVRDVAVKGGVIVNTGEGIPEQTPVANVRAMIQGIRNAWPEAHAP